MKSYKIGQILFIIPEKTTKLLPVQVVEIVTKKSLNGEEVIYMIKAGNDDSNIKDISKIGGEVFDSATIAKNVLIARSQTAIENIVNQAIKLSVSWYGENKFTDITEESIEQNLLEDLNQDNNTIVLEDGTKAKIKFSELMKINN